VALDGVEVAQDVDTVPDIETEDAPEGVDDMAEPVDEATIERAPDNSVSLAASHVRLLHSTLTELARLKSAQERVEKAAKANQSIVEQRERKEREASAYIADKAPVLQAESDRIITSARMFSPCLGHGSTSAPICQHPLEPPTGNQTRKAVPVAPQGGQDIAGAKAALAFGRNTRSAHPHQPKGLKMAKDKTDGATIRAITDGPRIDHDTLLAKIGTFNAADAKRASSAAESRQAIGEFLEDTNLHPKALSNLRAIVKVAEKKDAAHALDYIRSLEVGLPMVKLHIGGNQSEMDLEDDGPVEAQGADWESNAPRKPSYTLDEDDDGPDPDIQAESDDFDAQLAQVDFDPAEADFLKTTA